MATNKPITKDTAAEPTTVDERDMYSLLRARDEYDNASQASGSRLTAPQLRDFTHFHERIEYILDQNPDIDDPLYFTCQMVLGLVDSEGYRYFDLVKLEKPVPTAAREREREAYEKKQNSTARAAAPSDGTATEVTPKAEAQKKPRSFVPKPGAPKWVTTIPEPTDEEPEVEYQLQAVIGVSSDPCVLSWREYKKLIWTLAKMRGHLQETTGGQGNG